MKILHFAEAWKKFVYYLFTEHGESLSSSTISMDLYLSSKWFLGYESGDQLCFLDEIIRDKKISCNRDFVRLLFKGEFSFCAARCRRVKLGLKRQPIQKVLDYVSLLGISNASCYRSWLTTYIIEIFSKVAQNCAPKDGRMHSGVCELLCNSMKSADKTWIVSDSGYLPTKSRHESMATQFCHWHDFPLLQRSDFNRAVGDSINSVHKMCTNEDYKMGESTLACTPCNSIGHQLQEFRQLFLLLTWQSPADGVCCLTLGLLCNGRPRRVFLAPRWPLSGWRAFIAT
jgi:hypothetical protein